MNMNSRNVTYSKVGDYLLPNLTLPQQEKALGKYGRLRRTYLMKHRPVLYNSMLLSGTLHPHLLEVEQSAESRIQQTMQKLLEQNPAPNKEQHQMEWVQHMNSLNAQAEELVMNELIYSYRVNDKAYNKLGFSIHNYFFAKAIDQVRPGGIVAFVTSRYTLDSKDSSARKHIAERADLLGAIRLPNTAFKANAGTEVVSDIIFLQKRDRPKLCAVIDNILLSEKPASFEGFLQKLEQRGYEIKRGKYTSVKGTRQKRFIRFRTLGAGYSEDEIKAVIAGDAEHCPHQKQPPKEQPFHLLVDIQAKLSEGKSEGYARWAKKYNLKEMSKTLIFLQEKKIGSIKEMQERVDAATARYHELGDSIKAAETRMAEIAVLRTHIVNYAKTRPVYDAYRKAGYSKRFLENHRAEITLHKAAKAAFDESNLKTLPKVKELDAEYSKLLTEKKALYPDYRKAKDEMQELLRAQCNVELFFAEEKNTTEKTQSR